MQLSVLSQDLGPRNRQRVGRYAARPMSLPDLPTQYSEIPQRAQAMERMTQSSRLGDRRVVVLNDLLVLPVSV